MRKALVVGIDKYPSQPLQGCENDAASLANTLTANGDGSPNFSTILMSSSDTDVTSEALYTALEKLFSGEAETVLFYFSGHGILDETTNAGYIVSQDGKKGGWGVSLSDIISMANRAHPKIKSTVIILDSCNSGYVGEIQGLSASQVNAIGTGVTILTACHRDGTAEAGRDQSLFTSLLLDALSGGSADICGRITPASVYSHVDQALGAWGQRPIYKANVQSFITLRNIAPKIPFDVLRRLPQFFKNPTDVFALDPSYEPDRINIPQEYRDIPVNEENIRTFKELQLCNRHGLVVPVEAEHMYYAAINSKGCKLTALGAHYRKLAKDGKI